MGAEAGSAVHGAGVKRLLLCLYAHKVKSSLLCPCANKGRKFHRLSATDTADPAR